MRRRLKSRREPAVENIRLQQAPLARKKRTHASPTQITPGACRGKHPASPGTTRRKNEHARRPPVLPWKTSGFSRRHSPEKTNTRVTGPRPGPAVENIRFQQAHVLESTNASFAYPSHVWASRGKHPDRGGGTLILPCEALLARSSTTLRWQSVATTTHPVLKTGRHQREPSPASACHAP